MCGGKVGEAHGFHGALEVTGEHIKLSPKASNLETQRRILWDFISMEAKGHPWHDVGLPHHPEPHHLLSAVTPRVIDRLKRNGEDKNQQMPASSVLAERPFDGVFYALGITPIPDNPFHFRLCDIHLLAVLKGGVWQDLTGSLVTDQERSRAARTALKDIQALHQETLKRAERKR